MDNLHSQGIPSPKSLETVALLICLLCNVDVILDLLDSLFYFIFMDIHLSVGAVKDVIKAGVEIGIIFGDAACDGDGDLTITDADDLDFTALIELC